VVGQAEILPALAWPRGPKARNKAHNGKRAVGERGNSLLKTTFKALRNVSLCPWVIGRSSRPLSYSTTTTT
jgi:hypothetical protein